VKERERGRAREGGRREGGKEGEMGGERETEREKGGRDGERERNKENAFMDSRISRMCLCAFACMRC